MLKIINKNGLLPHESSKQDQLHVLVRAPPFLLSTLCSNLFIWNFSFTTVANEPCDMVSTSSTYALPDFLQTAHPICALPPHNNIHDPNHYQLIENNIDDNFVLNDNNVNNRNKRYVMPPFSAFIQPPPTHNTQKVSYGCLLLSFEVLNHCICAVYRSC